MKNTKKPTDNNRRRNEEWGDYRECGDTKRHKKTNRKDNNKRGDFG